MAKIDAIDVPKLIWPEAAAPSTPASGKVITYAKTDGLMYSKDDAGTETLMSGGGGGSGQGLIDYEFVKRTAGDLTLNSTTFADLPSLGDLVLTASTGDTIETGLMAVWNSEAVTAALDVATIVAASPVNYFGTGGGASDFGITSWLGTTGQVESAGASTMYTLVSGDISGGTVTLRIRYRTTAASNKTLRASATLPLLWWAKNIGPAM